jgi:2-hydroxychromene-2-carboxylate isomerase
MEKPWTSTSSRTSRTYSIHDPPGYIKPSLQDMLFTDIDAEELLKIAERLGVDYLGPAAEFPVSFPVEGEIYGPNKRLMVNLACRRRRTNTSAINIIFLIDTGSPASYLSAKAMEALIGNTGSHLPQQLPVLIQSLKNIECHISPHDKHFADVNVLGADFLVKNGLTLKANYSSDICTLMVEENE